MYRAGTGRRQADHQRRYPYAAVGWPLARLPARIRSLYDDLQSVQSMGQARTLASDLRGLGQARQRFRGSVSGFYIDQKLIAMLPAEKGGVQSGDRSLAWRGVNQKPTPQRSPF